jgi:hypothetical protein
MFKVSQLITTRPPRRREKCRRGIGKSTQVQTSTGQFTTRPDDETPEEKSLRYYKLDKQVHTDGRTLADHGESAKTGMAAALENWNK